MRQFDVLPNPNPASRGYAPYVVVLQSHHLDALDTTLLAPLVNDATRAITAIDLPLTFHDQAFVLVVAEMAGLPRRLLTTPVGTLAVYEDQIRRAIERLLTGF